MLHVSRVFFLSLLFLISISISFVVIVFMQHEVHMYNTCGYRQAGRQTHTLFVDYCPALMKNVWEKHVCIWYRDLLSPHTNQRVKKFRVNCWTTLNYWRNWSLFFSFIHLVHTRELGTVERTKSKFQKRQTRILTINTSISIQNFQRYFN